MLVSVRGLTIVRNLAPKYNHGVSTFESCQGGQGHASARQIVRFGGGSEAAGPGILVAVPRTRQIRACSHYVVHRI